MLLDEKRKDHLSTFQKLIVVSGNCGKEATVQQFWLMELML